MTQYEFCWRKEIRNDRDEVEIVVETLSNEELTEVARKILTKAGARALASRVVVQWNPRMRSTAGIAYPARNLVYLNPRLRQFGDIEMDRTLRHELAHLLAYERAHRRRISAHGPEWRKACEDLGLKNESRTHTLPLPRRSLPKKHFYRCKTCGLEVGRVKPLKRGSACLQCCRSYNRGHYDSRFRFIKI